MSEPARAADTVVPRSTVRGEVGADVHLTRATGLGHLQDGTARPSADHTEARATRLAEFGVEGMDGGHQPRSSRHTRRAQQDRVEDEQWQHGRALVDGCPQRRIVRQAEVTSYPPHRGD